VTQQPAPTPGPIIVRIIEDPPESQLEGLADVLLGALGLTGAIAVSAIVLGIILGSVMFWIRSRTE
jgi:hypothetical protein